MNVISLFSCVSDDQLCLPGPGVKSRSNSVADGRLSLLADIPD